MIFFNVKEARDFLIKHGLVYTLRKERKRIGKDIAVRGSRFKHTKIADVIIGHVIAIDNWHELGGFVNESGFEYAQEWFEKARKLSGNQLVLYLVKTVGNKTENSTQNSNMQNS